MRNYLLSFLMSILICACRCSQTELTASEKEWINAYRENQILIFKSDLNHFDTLVVKIKRNFYSDCNMLETGSVKFHIMSVNLEPKTCPDTNYCVVTISIEKENQNTPALPFIRAFALEYSPHIQSDQLTGTNITLSTSHKSYDSCYIFESSLNTTSAGINYLISFVWDKRDGLIRYTNKRNETFELVKN
jgi:hypothetical protein